MGRLHLSELNLSNNCLGDGKSDWKWLQLANIRKSLRELDLSANKLDYFPSCLIKLDNLVTLKLNNNQLKRVPFAIRRLRNLRFIHLSTNQLESLPSAFNNTRLDMLDVWGNNFQPQKEYDLDHCSSNGVNHSQVQNLYTPSSLWILAARAVRKHKIPFGADTLPWILMDVLTEAPICACNKLCFGATVMERAAMATFENVKNLVFSRDRLIYADIVLCGAQCAGRKQIVAS